MTDAIKTLHDYLSKSPSVVYPQDLLEYLSAIEAENDKLIVKLNSEHIVRQNVEIENARLRELCSDIYEMAYHEYPSAFEATFSDRMRELGVKNQEL